jgi:hypothetical protein
MIIKWWHLLVLYHSISGAGNEPLSIALSRVHAQRDTAETFEWSFNENTQLSMHKRTILINGLLHTVVSREDLEKLMCAIKVGGDALDAEELKDALITACLIKSSKMVLALPPLKLDMEWTRKLLGTFKDDAEILGALRQGGHLYPSFHAEQYFRELIVGKLLDQRVVGDEVWQLEAKADELIASLGVDFDRDTLSKVILANSVSFNPNKTRPFESWLICMLFDRHAHLFGKLAKSAYRSRAIGQERFMAAALGKIAVDDAEDQRALKDFSAKLRDLSLSSFHQANILQGESTYASVDAYIDEIVGRRERVFKIRWTCSDGEDHLVVAKFTLNPGSNDTGIWRVYNTGDGAITDPTDSPQRLPLYEEYTDVPLGWIKDLYRQLAKGSTKYVPQCLHPDDHQQFNLSATTVSGPKESCSGLRCIASCAQDHLGRPLYMLYKIVVNLAILDALYEGIQKNVLPDGQETSASPYYPVWIYVRSSHCMARKWLMRVDALPYGKYAPLCRDLISAHIDRWNGDISDIV